MKTRALPVLAMTAIFAFGCEEPVSTSGSETSSAAPVAWAYQLQDTDPERVAANQTFDWIVMDASATGGPDGAYSVAQVESISSSGKRPICYLSIGEAEEYRGYWDPAWNTNPPSWLGPENPDWPGNYKVRFWEPGWQQIIFDRIRAITAQGFQGLYLDIVDGYYYWSVENPENTMADRDMAQFVLAIGDTLREYGGIDQLLVPQNGEYIVVESHVAGALAEQYLSTIDAIGIEDIFYYGEADENNPWSPDTGRQQVLADEFLPRGIEVLSVEYLTVPTLIEQYRQAAWDRGYHPYASVRALDVLTDGLPSEPVSAAGDEPLGFPTSLTIHPMPGLQDRTLSLAIHSELPPTQVRIRLFDVRGHALGMQESVLSPGESTAQLHLERPLSSSVLLYRVESDSGTLATGKFLVVK